MSSALVTTTCHGTASEVWLQRVRRSDLVAYGANASQRPARARSSPTWSTSARESAYPASSRSGALSRARNGVVGVVALPHDGEAHPDTGGTPASTASRHAPSGSPFHTRPDLRDDAGKATELGDGFSVSRDRHALSRLHPVDHLPALFRRSLIDASVMGRITRDTPSRKPQRGTQIFAWQSRRSAAGSFACSQNSDIVLHEVKGRAFGLLNDARFLLLSTPHPLGIG